MAEFLIVTPRRGDSFNKGRAFLNKYGGQFDGGRKAWRFPAAFVDGCKRPDETREQYLRRNGVELIQPAADPATTWMGQASMDHPDSIF